MIENLISIFGWWANQQKTQFLVKVQWCVLVTLQVKSWSGSCNEKNFSHSARLLRELDHVLLWILSTDTGLRQCSICAEWREFQWLAMFSLYTLPLARHTSVKIQMLTTSSRIVTILLKSLLKSLGLYLKITKSWKMEENHPIW